MREGRNEPDRGDVLDVAADEVGRLKFSGNPADPAEQPETPSTSGGSWAFYQAVVGGSGNALYVYPSGSGCYAIQIDGAHIQDVITITAS